MIDNIKFENSQIGSEKVIFYFYKKKIKEYVKLLILETMHLEL